MTVKLFAFTCGTVTGELGRLMEGGEGDITVPVPVFLIEHPKGRALFDTGLHPDCQHDPAGRLGERLAGLFEVGFARRRNRRPARGDRPRPGQDRPRHQLAFPFRPLRRQRPHPQRDAPGAAPRVGRRHGPGKRPTARLQPARFRPRPQIAPHRRRARRVRRRLGHLPADPRPHARPPVAPRAHDSGDIVLAANSCYFCQTLRERRLPRFAYDRDAMLASLDRLEALEKAGARIVFGHDPEFWQPSRKPPR